MNSMPESLAQKLIMTFVKLDIPIDLGDVGDMWLG